MGDTGSIAATDCNFAANVAATISPQVDTIAFATVILAFSRLCCFLRRMESAATDARFKPRPVAFVTFVFPNFAGRDSRVRIPQTCSTTDCRGSLLHLSPFLCEPWIGRVRVGSPSNPSHRVDPGTPKGDASDSTRRLPGRIRRRTGDVARSIPRGFRRVPQSGGTFPSPRDWGNGPPFLAPAPWFGTQWYNAPGLCHWGERGRGHDQVMRSTPWAGLQRLAKICPFVRCRSTAPKTHARKSRRTPPT